MRITKENAPKYRVGDKIHVDMVGTRTIRVISTRTIRIISGEAKLGFEWEYDFSWKRRHVWSKLCMDTPWWQWRKKYRRWKAWLAAIDDTHRFGQDSVWEGNSTFDKMVRP